MLIYIIKSFVVKKKNNQILRKIKWFRIFNKNFRINIISLKIKILKIIYNHNENEFTLYLYVIILV